MALRIRHVKGLISRCGVWFFQARRYAEGDVGAAPAPPATALVLTLAGSNETFYDKVPILQVDVPCQTGCFGVLMNHVPLLGVLKAGIVTVIETKGSTKYFVSSGVINVHVDSTVQILAEECHPIDSISGQAAQELLSAAQNQLSQANTDVARAEAFIATEVAQALVEASSGSTK